MEFGILFTSHPNTDAEPCPHRDVHARVTREIMPHYPPWYGVEKALASLELFAAEVIPRFGARQRARRST